MSTSSVLKEIEGLLGQCEVELQQVKSALGSPTRLAEDVQQTAYQSLKKTLVELQFARDVIACW